MGTKDTPSAVARILFWSAVIFNVAVWIDLVAMLNYWGFYHGATPIQLGVLVMSFSGSMALATAMGSGRIQKRNVLAMMGAALGSGMIMVLHLSVASFAAAIGLILIKGLLIGCFVNGQEVLLRRMTSPQLYEALDKRFEWLVAIVKCAGPLAAGLSVMVWQPQVTVWIAAVTYAVTAIPAAFLSRPARAGEASREEPAQDNGNVQHPGEAPDASVRAYLMSGLIILAAMSFFVTVGDSQLVVLFRDIYQWDNAAIVAYVMAAAGLGTLLVRMRVESSGGQPSFKAISLSSAGLALVFLAVTWAMSRHMDVAWLLGLFFAGGICWQIGFSLYLKKLGQLAAARAKMVQFGTVMALTYILGPLFGGMGVAWLGIGATFLWAGVCILVFGLAASAGYAAILAKLRKSAQRSSHPVKEAK